MNQPYKLPEIDNTQNEKITALESKMQELQCKIDLLEERLGIHSKCFTQLDSFISHQNSALHDERQRHLYRMQQLAGPKDVMNLFGKT